MILKRFAKIAFLVLLSVFVLATVSLLAVFLYFYQKTPVSKDLTDRSITQTTTIYDKTGQHILYEIHGEENRKVLPHDQIPDNIRIATIATEDNNFYSHYGIDFLSILRAIRNDIQKNGAAEGASTITQQLAKNVFLTPDKTFRRKFIELVIAIKLEREYSKDQILDMYLNQIPYGSNAYGIESASNIFFGKSAKDLTLDEAALIAALPKATSYYSPYGNHLDELIRRQQKILDRIEELHLADDYAVANAKNIDVKSKLVPFSEKIEAPHFVFYVKDELEQKFGKDVIDGGLKVYTTLDYDLQKNAEQSIADNENNLQKYGASNAALVSLDPTNGNILAMVGSKNYYDKSIDGNVNVTISPRQPGSSFKPFIYATAFEKGFNPDIHILDAPTDFGSNGSGGDYIPQNYDFSFHGVVTMRQALSNSLNIPAVKTLVLAGMDNAVSLINRLGVKNLSTSNNYGLSLALGGAEVRMLDEASGYAVFADDGKKNPINSILKVEDAKGNILYTSTPQALQVIDPQIAREISSVLSDNGARSMVFGTGSKLYIPGKTVAAKTGTTSDFKDAWTAGYTPHIVAVVWAGNNNSQPMKGGADGSYVAAPIWNEFMKTALAGSPDEPFTPYAPIDPTNPDTVFDNVIYTNTKSGKKMSEEKASKKDPNKVKVEVQYSTADSAIVPAYQEIGN